MIRKIFSLLVLLIATSYATQSEDQNRAELTPDARDKIVKKMAARPTVQGSALFLFDKDGQLEKRIVFPQSALDKYKSLEDFVKSKDKPKPTPISSCESPKPTPPPPECVICKNGHIVCSDAEDNNQVKEFKANEKH
jgi:hypothetical protein